MKDTYDLYHDFDIDEHAKTYKHYLEVIMFPDGYIEYAVPSHQEKLIKVACEQLKLSREQLYAKCPPNYYFDVIVWLCNITRCVSIWTDGIVTSDTTALTKEQKETLNLLSKKGLYEGKLI